MVPTIRSSRLLYTIVEEAKCLSNVFGHFLIISMHCKWVQSLVKFCCTVKVARKRSVAVGKEKR
ncbi:unnamed protein product, partial [Heterotrigona itama]